jgi:hypothetical protein
MDDYRRFRSVMQALDLMILDLNYVRFSKRDLVAAAIYIQLALYF